MNLAWIKTIMVGTDGSDASNRAVKTAAIEAKIHNAGLIIVNAIGFSTQYSSPSRGITDAVVNQAKKALDDGSSIAEKAGVKNVKIEQLQADPARYPTGDSFVRAEKMIVRYAQDHNVDLLVVGSHGRSRISRMLLGSVSEYVVHHAPCAVLVCREK